MRSERRGGANESTDSCAGTTGCAPSGGQRRPQSSVAGTPAGGRGTSTPPPGLCANAYTCGLHTGFICRVLKNQEARSPGTSGDVVTGTGHCHTAPIQWQTVTASGMQSRLRACGRAGRLATALAPPPIPLPRLGSAAVIAAEFVPATAGSAYKLEPSVATTTSSLPPPVE